MTGSGKELVLVKRNGRPPGTGMYTEAIAEEVLERLSNGETLVSICRITVDGEPRERKSFPSHWTVYDWGDPNSPSHNPEFSPRFARAKLNQQRTWLEEIVDIANTPESGLEELVEHSARNGVTIRRARKDMLQHRALKIETRLKAIARMNPQLWAERLQQAAPSERDSDNEAPRLIITGGLPDEDGPAPQATKGVAD